MGTVLKYASPAVIACDKRVAFAQGSEATKQSIDPRARKDGLLGGACHHCASAIAQCLGPQLTMRMRLCAVQKWHTSSRRISLCRAICLAKI